MSYENVYQWMKNNYPQIKACQTIIMYNGEVVMLSKNACGYLERFTSFYDLNMNLVDSIIISRIDSKNNKNKG